MPSKYDVFAQIIEKAPCKAKDLLFNTPVYAHINALESKGWVKEIQGKYIPVKNKETKAGFDIIKYCLKNGLDYNIFFSRNVSDVLNSLFRHAPNLRPSMLKNNIENTKILHYLEENQFVLITKLRPRRGVILKHQLIDSIFKLNNIKLNTETSHYLEIRKKVLGLDPVLVNPFDNSVFKFLAGSAMLEGSTVSIGETKDLIVNDIYPDKPKKDIQMVKNLNEAMHFVLDNLHKEITVSDIKKLNWFILFSLHRNAGKFKKAHNKIQGNPDFKTAAPRRVHNLLEEFCQKLNQITTKESCLDTSGYIHNQLQFIHPFSDGNSRTVRMVLNWMFLKHNLPLLVIKMGSFDEYMSLTKLAKKRNDKKLSRLFQHMFLHESLI